MYFIINYGKIKLTQIYYKGGFIMCKFKEGILVFLMVICTVMALTGCSFKNHSEVTSLEEVHISNIEDSDYFKTMPEEQLIGGIFQIVNTEKEEQYILFYEMNINSESISWNIDNEVLEININTTNDKVNTLAYKILKPKKTDFDTITLIKDGEEIPFTFVVCS